MAAVQGRREAMLCESLVGLVTPEHVRAAGVEEVERILAGRFR